MDVFKRGRNGRMGRNKRTIRCDGTWERDLAEIVREKQVRLDEERSDDLTTLAVVGNESQADRRASSEIIAAILVSKANPFRDSLIAGVCQV